MGYILYKQGKTTKDCRRVLVSMNFTLQDRGSSPSAAKLILWPLCKTFEIDDLVFITLLCCKFSAHVKCVNFDF